ncbi:hypothetical protein Pan241w_11200 [Gimesia alba]|uniref:Uncharacterized protein n=1 Tax=Gimesia alba TaxID=2527973 RepID=A0A517RB09_9PLAN|nr:hypothetical protein [Gimesia alba]QDT41061.1 hypothetical protein Pan241w_11200 [Gimesia alba]
MSRAFIPDGYTEDGFIAESKGVHEAVRFKFRPVLPEAVRALMHNFYEKTAKAQSDIVNETLKRQLVEWDLCDLSDTPLKITTSNLCRIKKPLKDRLFNIVTCYEGSDDDQDSDSQKEDEDLNFDELLSGESDGAKTPAEKQLEEVKN